ncbi:hypothetical protein T10_4607 [Trichinella papuae]|uniref:Uncharacterized protein n=1 Tax=Trichinella papuae TaxID=268474 RepID=A0A0V1MAH3_9BILA|nr:hypothetical protein T10_4607 [Trichinella papuae]
MRPGSFENCLIISNGALVCLTYVASNSIVKRSLSSFKAFNNYGSPFSIKNLYIIISSTENADDTKQIADDTKQIEDDTKQIEDDTKQNCGMKTYGICGSPWIPIL